MKVNVGARPEDLLFTSGEAMFTGEVEFTEALGEVTLLYFKRQGDNRQVIAKLPGIIMSCAARPCLSTAPEKVQIFANGKSLRYR